MKHSTAYSSVTNTAMLGSDLAAYRQTAYNNASLPTTLSDFSQLFYDDCIQCLSTADETSVEIRKENAQILSLLYAECVLGTRHREVTRGLHCLASHCYKRQPLRRVAVLSYCVLRQLDSDTKSTDFVDWCTTVNMLCDAISQYLQQARLFGEAHQVTIQHCADLLCVLLFLKNRVAKTMKNHVQSGNLFIQFNRFTKQRINYCLNYVFDQSLLNDLDKIILPQCHFLLNWLLWTLIK